MHVHAHMCAEMIKILEGLYVTVTDVMLFFFQNLSTVVCD